MKRTSWLGHVVLAATMTACGGGGGPPSIETLCDEDGLYPDYYELLFDCSPLYALVVGDQLTRADTSMACHESLGPYLDDGTVVLGTAGAFDACADWIAAGSCDDIDARGVPNPCDDILVGTVPAGGLCDASNQCAGESYCDQPDVNTCGSCTPLKANTAACAARAECLSDRCDDATGECADLIPAGGTCAVDDDCEGVLVCSDTAMECVTEPTWAVGSPCTEVLADCGFGETDLYCNQTTMLCAQFRSAGDTCGQSDANSVCHVFEYESCQEVPAASGMYECVAPTIVNQGDECAFGTGQQCDTGLRCEDHDDDTNTPDQCITPLGAGDACNPDNNLCDFLLNCIAGACQYGEYTGTCPPPAA